MPLDDFTQRLFDIAYEQVFASRTLSAPPDDDQIESFKSVVGAAWCEWRDAQIEAHAARILARVPETKLRSLEGVIIVLMIDYDPGLATWPASDDEAPCWAAANLAVLRWINRENAGRVPRPEYAQAREWLMQHCVTQMALPLEVTA